MAQLIVRDLDEEIVTRLKRRAARNGRSMEAEHRELLRQVLLAGGGRKSLKQALLDMPDLGRDNDFARIPDRGRKIPL
jgi:plasmid stability protein